MSQLDGIIKGLTKLTIKLDNLSERNKKTCLSMEEDVVRIQIQQKELRSEADRADRIQSKVRELLA